MEEHAGSCNVTWFDCSRELRAAGYNHTAGDNFARIKEKGRGLDHARIKRDASGAHWIEYGKAS